MGGSTAEFSFLSSRHAETAVFVHSSTEKAPKHHCRHPSTINRVYREVYRCDPRTDLAEEMKGTTGQKPLS